MKETLKRIKADIIVSALLCIALGIVLLVWPAETIDVFCKILAVGLIIMGGVDIASYFMNRSIHPFAGALGLIVLLIGIWIFLRPESIVSLIPIVIGGILLDVFGAQGCYCFFALWNGLACVLYVLFGLQKTEGGTQGCAI